MKKWWQEGIGFWLEQRVCWFRYGHIWYDVGTMWNNGMMVQCRHCAITRVVNCLTGKFQ